MPRARLGATPMTATERSARRRQQEQERRAEVERLRAEVAALRLALGLNPEPR